MQRKKTQDAWIDELSKELTVQAQKSFQIGVFEEITNPLINDRVPELMKPLNNLLTCANLLLNHARENMTMLNRINHSGMWSMYFGEGNEISRVVFTDEFREITGYTDHSELPDL